MLYDLFETIIILSGVLLIFFASLTALQQSAKTNTEDERG